MINESTAQVIEILESSSKFREEFNNVIEQPDAVGELKRFVKYIYKFNGKKLSTDVQWELIVDRGLTREEV